MDLNKKRPFEPHLTLLLTPHICALEISLVLVGRSCGLFGCSGFLVVSVVLWDFGRVGFGVGFSLGFWLCWFGVVVVRRANS